jgi:hypothetical protein
VSPVSKIDVRSANFFIKRQEGLLESLALEAVKRMVEELEIEIQFLATGRRIICEIKDGKIVDSTYETLVQKKVFRERLSDLISKLQATASGKG